MFKIKHEFVSFHIISEKKTWRILELCMMNFKMSLLFGWVVLNSNTAKNWVDFQDYIGFPTPFDHEKKIGTSIKHIKARIGLKKLIWKKPESLKCLTSFNDKDRKTNFDLVCSTK